jgi:hypothetical protein
MTAQLWGGIKTREGNEKGNKMVMISKYEMPKI